MSGYSHWHAAFEGTENHKSINYFNRWLIYPIRERFACNNFSSCVQISLYAVKIIKRASDDTSELLVDVDDEAINWRRHKDMPNVIKTYDIWDDTHASLATRLCVRIDWIGCSLHVLISNGTRYYGPPWFEIMRGIANGINQAHMHGIIHGDLKPSNSLSYCSIN
jgi:serine/threonine protein kinase